MTKTDQSVEPLPPLSLFASDEAPAVTASGERVLVPEDEVDPATDPGQCPHFEAWMDGQEPEPEVGVQGGLWCMSCGTDLEEAVRAFTPIYFTENF